MYECDNVSTMAESTTVTSSHELNSASAVNNKSDGDGEIKVHNKDRNNQIKNKKKNTNRKSYQNNYNKANNYNNENVNTPQNYNRYYQNSRSHYYRNYNYRSAPRKTEESTPSPSVINNTFSNTNATYTKNYFQSSHPNNYKRYKNKDEHSVNIEENGAPSSTSIENGVQISNTKEQKEKTNYNLTSNKKQNKFPFKNKRFLKKKPKSNAELETHRESLIDALRKGTYECMVCLKELKSRDYIWNCKSCFHIFHLKCIQKWSKSSEESTWRCPGCQFILLEIPTEFRCFCGKVKNPAANFHEIPFSCGSVCQKSRGENCIHPCNLLCHPGPCVPCQTLVKRSCSCGKETKSVQCCSQIILHCEEPCLKILNCNIHKCNNICHSGPCLECTETFDRICFCGNSTKKVNCGTLDSKQLFSCDKICNKKLSCNNHMCESTCHPGPCGDCLRSIEKNICACGKSNISNDWRKSCLDLLPTCNQRCGKKLNCGKIDEPHYCKEICHNGDCPQCEGTTTLKCSCGAYEEKITCSELKNKTIPIKCNIVCNKKFNCKRHRCREKCCADKIHDCKEICGKKLSCGAHYCEETCHRGSCHTCWNVSFDELFCECGKSVAYPPIACGQKPPNCKEPCSRVHSCNHPVSHACHFESDCPKCAVLVERLCMGGHEIRKNIPCFLSDISCGLRCGKLLSCGQHFCLRNCHKGDCAEPEIECTQKCERKRPSCGHPCNEKCHKNDECPDVPCASLIDLECECGRKVIKVPCSTSLRSTNSITPMFHKDDGVVNLVALKEKLQQQRLPCDKICNALLRRKKMADALGIDPERPDSSGLFYTEFLKSFARLNPAFVSSIETALKDLVLSVNISKLQNKSHSFPCMTRDKRHVVHELAEFYNCTTETFDEEPNKNVVASAKKGVAKLPNILLTEVIRRSIYGRTMQPANISSEINDETKNEIDNEKETTKVEQKKTIDYFDFDNN